MIFGIGGDSEWQMADFKVWEPLSEAIAFLTSEGLPTRYVDGVCVYDDGRLLIGFFAPEEPGVWDTMIEQAGYEVVGRGANTRTIRKK